MTFVQYCGRKLNCRASIFLSPTKKILQRNTKCSSRNKLNPFSKIDCNSVNILIGIDIQFKPVLTESIDTCTGKSDKNINSTLLSQRSFVSKHRYL